MIAQQFRHLNVYCRYLYFMKTGHEINCCVFKSHECICNSKTKVVIFGAGCVALDRRCAEAEVHIRKPKQLLHVYTDGL